MLRGQRGSGGGRRPRKREKREGDRVRRSVYWLEEAKGGGKEDMDGERRGRC